MERHEQAERERCGTLPSAIYLKMISNRSRDIFPSGIEPIGGLTARAGNPTDSRDPDKSLQCSPGADYDIAAQALTRHGSWFECSRSAAPLESRARQFAIRKHLMP